MTMDVCNSTDFNVLAGHFGVAIPAPSLGTVVPGTDGGWRGCFCGDGLCGTPQGSKRRSNDEGFVFARIALSLRLFASLSALRRTSKAIEWVHRDKIRMGWTPERFEQYQMMKMRA